MNNTEYRVVDYATASVGEFAKLLLDEWQAVPNTSKFNLRR